MDPALREVLRQGPPDRMVEAIIRFRRPGGQIPGVRIVARFGPIVTCRLQVSQIRQVRADPQVVSLKAARSLGPQHPAGPATGTHDASWPGRSGELARRPPGLSLTGRGAVVAVIDWHLDVDHPNFKNPDGSTRLIALWDQRASVSGPDFTGTTPEPYGYGVVHDRDRIDLALLGDDPYDDLGYHIAEAGHGTHVTDIAAGNGRVGDRGMAPGAGLIFVHLADHGTGGLANLGDSVRLLEAIDFVDRTAGERPCVINLSMGRHGGPHDGCTLTEIALDEFLSRRAGRFVVQSAGNYHETRTHATGIVGAGQPRTLRFITDPADVTPNEVEIWYPGADEFTVRIDPPGAGVTTGTPGPHGVALGATGDIVADGQVVGRLYHRRSDPNNHRHHVDAFLSARAPAGEWRVTLDGVRVEDGRFHAWIERDDSCAGCQARFVADDASPDHTTGTIANARLPLVVASYDERSPARELGRSSSAGPTVDGRAHPHLAAPGVGILAACATAPGSRRSAGALIRKSGTSMAAPHVTGAIALCMEHAGAALDAPTIRRLVLSAADPPKPGSVGENRLGAGYLNVPALIGALLRTRFTQESEVADMNHPDVAPLSQDPARAYRELLYRPTGDLASWLKDRFTILAGPGESLRNPLEEGDVVLRAALGRLDQPGELGVIAESSMTRRRTSTAARPAGWYARSGAGAPGWRGSLRVLDHTGRVPPGQLLLRPASPGEPAEPDQPDQPDPADGIAEVAAAAPASADCGCVSAAPHWKVHALRPAGPESEDDFGTDFSEDFGEDQPVAGPPPWTGTPEQVEFRGRVLAKHIALSQARRGKPLPDLLDADLSDVPGTCTTSRGKTSCVRTRTATAAAAGDLLAAATRDLVAARAAGDADAARTLGLGATSGYRGSEHQRNLWLRYFREKYYNRSRAARAAIPEGPHSDQAVDYLLRRKDDGGYGLAGRIAAPGYSNHQGGIAIDFAQDRIAGSEIRNDSDDDARARWRRSWFHGWLRIHAVDHHFTPIPTEEWHWEFHPPAAAAEGDELDWSEKAPSDPPVHLGGRLWTFTSKIHGGPIAIYCPPAALGKAQVDVLLYGHGLLDRCDPPATEPEQLINRKPFLLGHVVADSGRPLVLVVPLLSPSTKVGVKAFGEDRGAWYPIGEPSAFNALVAEIMVEVGRAQGISAPPSVRELTVAAHSRGWSLLNPLVANCTDPEMGRGALARLVQVWAFDVTYSGTFGRGPEPWRAWLSLNPKLNLRFFYLPGSDTGTVGDRFYAQRGGRLAVTHSVVRHCDVPHTYLAQLMPATAKPAGGQEADAESDLSATFGLHLSQPDEGEW